MRSPPNSSSPGNVYATPSALVKEAADDMQKAHSILPFSIRADSRTTGAGFDQIPHLHITTAAKAAVTDLLSQAPGEAGDQDFSISSVTMTRTANGGVFYSFQVEGLPFERAKWLSEHVTTTMVGGLLLRLPGWEDPVRAPLTDQGPSDQLFLMGISLSGSGKALSPKIVEKFIKVGCGRGLDIHWIGRHKGGSVSAISSTRYPDASFSTEGMAPIRGADIDMVALVRATREGHAWIDSGRSEGHRFTGVSSFLVEGDTLTIRLSKRFATLLPRSYSPLTPPSAPADRSQPSPMEEEEEEDEEEEEEESEGFKRLFVEYAGLDKIKEEVEALRDQLDGPGSFITTTHTRVKTAVDGLGGLLTTAKAEAAAASISAQFAEAQSAFAKAKAVWDTFDVETMGAELAAIKERIQEIPCGGALPGQEAKVDDVMAEVQQLYSDVVQGFRVVWAGELGEMRNWSIQAADNAKAMADSFTKASRVGGSSSKDGGSSKEDRAGGCSRSRSRSRSPPTASSGAKAGSPLLLQ
jgi:hypothetical protein